MRIFEDSDICKCRKPGFATVNSTVSARPLGVEFTFSIEQEFNS